MPCWIPTIAAIALNFTDKHFVDTDPICIYPSIFVAITLKNLELFSYRRSSMSRSQVAHTICERSNSDAGWPQMILFPEGTNTNRKLLIKFKLGAFIPGKAIQPLILRYIGYEEEDCITWTYHQSHSYMHSVWRIITKPINLLELEFLPIYKPNEEEMKDADLFASNLQCYMANALKTRHSNVTYHTYYNKQ